MIADCYSTSQIKKFATPSFTSYVMNVKAEEQSRIDIYIQLPFNNLRFEKTIDGFKGSYSMAFIVRDKTNEIVQTKEIDRKINVRTYEESVSQRFDFFFQSFILIPGRYIVEMISTDDRSNLRYRHREEIAVKNFNEQKVSASNILFLNTMLKDAKGISIRPILPSSISLLQDSVGKFQEIYHVQKHDTITIVESYSVPTLAEGKEQSFSYFLPPYKATQSECKSEYDSVYFKKDSTFMADRDGTIQIFQFYPLPAVGSTLMDTRIIVRRNGVADSIDFSKLVYRRDPRYRSTLSINEVLSAMRYILREQEYDSLVMAEGENQNILINKFWESRGGFERRKEFERRIFEANALFTNCLDGSRTAMGIVYIVCGTPDYIDCRGSFVESWYYNIGERAFAIQFKRDNDETSFFDLYPFSVNESVWQYFVDRWRRKR